MYLDVALLAEAIQKLPEKEWPASRNPVVIAGFSEPVLTSGQRITPFEIDLLQKNRVNRMDVKFSRRLLAALHTLKPNDFLLPTQVTSPADFLQEIRFIDFANQHSRYQRQVVSCMEEDGANGEVILRYNEPIDLKKWNRIRANWPEGRPIAFRHSEHKILLFLNLRLIAKADTPRFTHNIKIVETLAYKLHAYPEFTNLTKLSFERDILIVDDPEVLLDVYRRSDVRLILIGDGIDTTFRDALIRIKKYDPYARFMLAKNVDPKDEGVFLLAVEGNYTRDNWR